MTIDERFRADLRGALDDAAAGVTPLDAAALIATGDRTVRRRRLAAATVAVAIALVGALAVLPGLGQRLATPIAPPTGHATLTLPLTTPTGTQDTTFTVTVLTDGTVEYAAVRDGTAVPRGGSSLAGLDGQATIGTAGDDIVLGLVPDDAVRAGLLTTATTGSFTGAPENPVPLPGTGYSAVGFRLADSPPPGPDDLEPIWWRADGTPVTNTETGTGVVLPEAEVTLWYLPGHGLLGAGTPTQGLTTIMSAGVDGLAFSKGFGPDGTVSGMIEVFLLPQDATDVVLSFTEGVDAQPTLDQVWPGAERLVVVARGDWPTPRPSGDERPLATRVAWTDAGGVRQEWTP